MTPIPTPPEATQGLQEPQDSICSLINDLNTEADLCRNDGAEDIARLLDRAAKALSASPVKAEPDAQHWRERAEKAEAGLRRMNAQAEDFERKWYLEQDRAERLEAVLRDLVQRFPTDSNLLEAGWAPADIEAACRSYDRAREVLAASPPVEPAKAEPVKAESAHPEIHAMFETRAGSAIGSTSAPISRIECNDDGSFTVVIDHWPTPQDAPPAGGAQQPTGWVAPKDRYTTPVLFNPYTGEPRDARDIQSDPQGQLLVPPGALMLAPAHPAPLPSHGEDNDGDLSLDWMSDTGAVSLSLRNDGLVFFAWRDAGEGGRGRFNVPPGLVQALRKMPDGDGLLFDGSAPDKHVQPAPGGEDRRDAAGQIEHLDAENHTLREQVKALQREASTWNAALTSLAARMEILRQGHPRLEVRYWTGQWWEPLHGVRLDECLDVIAAMSPSGTSRPFTPEEHAAWERENGVGEAAKGEGKRG